MPDHKLHQRFPPGHVPVGPQLQPRGHPQLVRQGGCNILEISENPETRK